MSNTSSFVSYASVVKAFLRSPSLLAIDLFYIIAKYWQISKRTSKDMGHDAVFLETFPPSLFILIQSAIGFKLEIKLGRWKGNGSVGDEMNQNTADLNWSLWIATILAVVFHFSWVGYSEVCFLFNASDTYQSGFIIYIWLIWLMKEDHLTVNAIDKLIAGVSGVIIQFLSVSEKVKNGQKFYG